MFLLRWNPQKGCLSCIWQNLPQMLKKGPFAVCCNQKTLHEVTQHNSPPQAQCSSSDSDSSESNFFVGSVTSEPIDLFDKTPKFKIEYTCSDVSHDDWTVVLEKNGAAVEYKIDSGAQTNILPYQLYRTLPIKSKLDKTAVKLTAYNVTSIPFRGRCILNLLHKSKLSPVMFVIAETASAPVIGLKTSAHLKLIQRLRKIDQGIPDYILAPFGDCFGELGKLPKVHHITLKPGVVPVI